MTVKKKSRVRETSAARSVPAAPKVSGGAKPNGRSLPLRSYTERVISDYFTSLNGHHPAELYDLVLREVEEPLFRVVLSYAEGNQSRAAGILGINRATLRKKLRQHGLAS